MKSLNIIVEKNKKNDSRSNTITKDYKSFLSLNELVEIKILDLYQLEENSRLIEELKTPNRKLHIYSSSFKEYILKTKTDLFNEKTDKYFRVIYHQGEYNQKEEMINEWMNIYQGDNIKIDHSLVFIIRNSSEEEFLKIKDYFINEVETKEVDIDYKVKESTDSSLEDLEKIKGFSSLSDKGLEKYLSLFSMDIEDLKICRDYFKSEKRDPNMSELKIIDTYWSDHCRHTTFLTEIKDIEIEKGDAFSLIEETLNSYKNLRKKLNRKDEITLMDLATINTRKLKSEGKLKDLEESEEVNAASVFINVDIDGEDQRWRLYFKNETHNHPTEIEPYGGAATCVGGGIRDPLSGRSYVFGAMRISGGKNPNLKYEEGLEGKLPQRKISQLALEGNSDYANEIGLTSAYAKEYYYPGFLAKRFELGALMAAAPEDFVIREEPVEGDIVVILGGKTGRDGLGAAVGSSMVQTKESLEKAGAEVQKGNPFIERKIIRLFRNKEVTRLIKRCNDFGAGGVAVAVGELAAGLEIELDKVPVKYKGMHAGEIALSESQERMAVVINEKDFLEFKRLSKEEDLEAVRIAKIISAPKMIMKYNDEKLIEISRGFLNSNGSIKRAKAKLLSPKLEYFDKELFEEEKNLEKRIEKLFTALNFSSQKNIINRFDSSIGTGTVVLPLGGKNEITPEHSMVLKIPVLGSNTNTVAIMSHGYEGEMALASPFHAGYYAVIESVNRVIASGASLKNVKLTFQEYFESLTNEIKWGKPLLALLGAYKAMAELDIASVGGKDSMSGTFKDIDVPPTLVSFAIADSKIEKTLTRELKKNNSQLIYIKARIKKDKTIDIESLKEIYKLIDKLNNEKRIFSLSTTSSNGILHTALEMAMGNSIGLDFLVEEAELFKKSYGGFLLEISLDEDISLLSNCLDIKTIAKTRKDEKIIISSLSFDIDKITSLYQNTHKAFVSIERNKVDLEKVNLVKSPIIKTDSKEKIRVLIPVFTGTKGEYDLGEAYRRHGCDIRYFVFNTKTHNDYKRSVDRFLIKYKHCEILALPEGSLMGDMPYFGRVYENLLLDEKISEYTKKHLANGRLIMGIGSGFAALLNAGLIGDGSSYIETNSTGFLHSSIEDVKIVNKNIWTKNLVLGDNYKTILSTKYSRLKWSKALEESSNIVGVFLNSEDGSINIESAASKCTQVFGSISSTSRLVKGLYINTSINDKNMLNYIAGSVEYFRGK